MENIIEANNLINEIESLAAKHGYIETFEILANRYNTDVEYIFDLVANNSILIEKIKLEAIKKNLVRDLSFKKIQLPTEIF